MSPPPLDLNNATPGEIRALMDAYASDPQVLRGLTALEAAAAEDGDRTDALELLGDALVLRGGAGAEVAW